MKVLDYRGGLLVQIKGLSSLNGQPEKSKN